VVSQEGLSSTKLINISGSAVGSVGEGLRGPQVLKHSYFIIILLLLLLFNCTANGFILGDSGTTIRHNT
jgi:hypothetical protein